MKSCLTILIIMVSLLCFGQRDSLSKKEFNQLLLEKSKLNFEEIKGDTLELLDLVKVNNSLCANMVFTEERIQFDLFFDYKYEDYILDFLEFHMGPRKTLYSMKYDMFYDCGLVENDRSYYYVYDLPKLSKEELNRNYEEYMKELGERRKSQ